MGNCREFLGNDVSGLGLSGEHGAFLLSTGMEYLFSSLDRLLVILVIKARSFLKYLMVGVILSFWTGILVFLSGTGNFVGGEV